MDIIATHYAPRLWETICRRDGLGPRTFNSDMQHFYREASKVISQETLKLMGSGSSGNCIQYNKHWSVKAANIARQLRAAGKTPAQIAAARTSCGHIQFIVEHEYPVQAFISKALNGDFHSALEVEAYLRQYAIIVIITYEENFTLPQTSRNLEHAAARYPTANIEKIRFNLHNEDKRKT